jgi:hypothetical protein
MRPQRYPLVPDRAAAARTAPKWPVWLGHRQNKAKEAVMSGTDESPIRPMPQIRPRREKKRLMAKPDRINA